MNSILILSLIALMNASAEESTDIHRPDSQFKIHLSIDSSSASLNYEYDYTDPNNSSFSDFKFPLRLRVDSLTGDIILMNDSNEFNLGKPEHNDGWMIYLPLEGPNFTLTLSDSPSFPYPCMWQTGWAGLSTLGVCQSHQMNAHFKKSNGEEFNITCNEIRKCPVPGLGCPGSSTTNRKWQRIIGGDCR